MKRVDKIIIGGGIYGLYSALFCAKRGQKVVVLEYDSEVFSRATYVNQARVHNGYHYPRSYSTAVKSVKYFERFNTDYGFCIHKAFKKIYATSSNFSWSSADQFKQFCRAANIMCDEISHEKYFKEGVCDGVFETLEYTLDAQLLGAFFLDKIGELSNCEIVYNSRFKEVRREEDSYTISLSDGQVFKSGFVLNATYGSTNQVLDVFGFERFKIKYELCEMILCKVSDNIRNAGITLMDGPFFSLMPFGKTGYHSLSAVTYTPHKTSNDNLPTFDCQAPEVGCSPKQLANCNSCANKPKTSWPFMRNLAKKYLRDDIEIEFVKELFSIKAVLKSSEIDDSRPTIIRKFSEAPYFYTVLSGKINTIYDLDEILVI